MKILKLAISVVAISPILVGPTVQAEVLEASAGGFLVQNKVAVSSDAVRAYEALVNDVGQWWDAAHTWSGDSRNMTIDGRAGGCFCEVWDDRSVQHMEVVYAHPGAMLRMRGALGPLQASGLTGSMTWGFEAQGDSTRISLRYSVGGYMQGDLQEIAPVVDGVLRGQLARFKGYVDAADPEGTE